MLSDMLWRGLFHCHIMTSGGKTATPARTVQPDSDASGRRGRTHVRNPDGGNGGSDSSCMLKVYGRR
jgi:hypothetical protein